ncbi:hypothetical protein CAPTEDRAFT_199516 [Capitella teleta]|uniref:Carbohydrate sulfotransferase n=1 Tax=Capitella teleta TaxID=283909 RepID=R7TKZ7_CAPTE|nr:hypothetical protein CAPTEDRAFT_199516 [Capitella teleta]|eukprot:ELT94197.1 hypothetical protein CAPTEDRAFT_199516 [Capitella teleta]
MRTKTCPCSVLTEAQHDGEGMREMTVEEQRADRGPLSACIGDLEFGYAHDLDTLEKHGIIPILSGKLPREYFNYYKLLQVRHPFTRLISAYKDKIVDNLGLGPDNDTRLCRALEKGIFPTWVQFAELVANRNSSCMNKHWMPYTEVCPVCDMEFDAVTKIETISTDTNDFVKRLDINDSFHFDQKRASQSAPGKTIEDYMNELPKDVLSKLKKMFHTDMQLFGYEIDSDRRLSCRYQVHDEDGKEWLC